MECTDAKLRMEPYATGNLASPDREAFEAHVEHCEGCRLELELTRALSGSTDAEEPGAPGASPVDAAAPFGDAAAPSLPASASASPAPGSPSPVDAEISFADIAPGDEGPSSDFSLDALLASALPSAASAMPAPPAPVPDPLANLTPPPPAQTQAPPAAPASADSWDFEPADAKPHSRPPEGSLFFAQEALTRTRDADEKRKLAVVRTSLWVAGGLVGVALLLFAGWIALRAHPGAPQSANAVPPSESTDNRALEATPAAGESSQGAVQPNAVEPVPSRAPASPEPAAAPSIASETTADARQGTAVVQAGAGDARSPLPQTQITAPTQPGALSVQPAKTARTAPRAVVKAHARRPASTPANGTGAASRPGDAGAPSSSAPRTAAAGVGTPAPPVAETAPPKPAVTEAAPREPLAPSAASETAMAPAKPEATGPASTVGPPPVQPGTTTSAASGATDGAGSAATAPATGASSTPSGAVTPPASAAGPAPAASGAAPESSSSAPTRPIDRIHMATVAAEERGDVEALRTLRERWRTFIQRTGVGADRSRAKRELADCLWAIQAATARRSDQREALQAFRDYILNAPAGGADARSISRARQLEDALSESR